MSVLDVPAVLSQLIQFIKHSVDIGYLQQNHVPEPGQVGIGSLERILVAFALKRHNMIYDCDVLQEHLLPVSLLCSRLSGKAHIQNELFCLL